MTTFTRWSDIRDEHIERVGREEFAAGKQAMPDETRRWRLAETSANAIPRWSGSGG